MGKKRIGVLLTVLAAVGLLAACSPSKQDTATSTSSAKVSQTSKKKAAKKSRSASSETSSAASTSSTAETSSASTSSAASSSAKPQSALGQETGRLLRIAQEAWDVRELTTAEANSGAADIPPLYTLSDGPRFESKGPTEWLHINVKDPVGADLANKIASMPAITIDELTLKPLKQYALTPAQVQGNHDIMDEYLQWNSHWFFQTPTHLYIYQQ